MAIGRTDERDTPCHPTAHCDAADVLRARSRKPSGPRSSIPHRKAGHMIALVPAASFSAQLALEPSGPSIHGWRAFADHDGGNTSLSNPKMRIAAPRARSHHRRRHLAHEVFHRLE